MKQNFHRVCWQFVNITIITPTNCNQPTDRQTLTIHTASYTLLLLYCMY